DERTVLSRFLTNGSPDKTFGRDGALELIRSDERSDQEAFAIARSSTGAIFIAGYSGKDKTTAAAIWAFTPDGTLRSDFGDGGRFILPNAGGIDERIYAITFDAEGRLLATGFSNTREN